MFLESFSSALRSLREHAQRSILSSLGILVGSSAIVLLIGIGQGVQADIGKQVESLGVNLLIVLPFRVNEDSSMFTPGAAGFSFLREEDIASVRRVSGVRTAVPLMFVGGGVQYAEKQSPTTIILATGSDWFRMRPTHMVEGSPFDAKLESKPVCVIGAIARKNLFGGANCVGRKVDVNGTKYKVVGVTSEESEDQSLFSMMSLDNVCFIPYHYLKLSGQPTAINRIFIQTRPEVEPKNLIQQVDAQLGKRLRPSMYSVVTQKDLLKLIFKLMSILSYLLSGLTSIALFVGGFGIMAIMWMSVNERRKEIGLRKAVGARNRDVFSQFLCESVLLGLLGGTSGLIFSEGVCWWLARNTPIRPLITWNVIVLCFAISLGVGAIFGVLPAVSASRKDPVESLRNE